LPIPDAKITALRSPNFQNTNTVNLHFKKSFKLKTSFRYFHPKLSAPLLPLSQKFYRPSMRISYRTLDGSHGFIDLPLTATVNSLRTSLSISLGLSVRELILIFHSSVLPDTATLTSLSLTPTDFILVHSSSITSTFELRPPEPPSEPKSFSPQPSRVSVIGNMVSYIRDELPHVHPSRVYRALQAAGFDPDEAIMQLIQQGENFGEGELEDEENDYDDF
jgi:hypothetical protein